MLDIVATSSGPWWITLLVHQRRLLNDNIPQGERGRGVDRRVGTVIANTDDVSVSLKTCISCSGQASVCASQSFASW